MNNSNTSDTNAVVNTVTQSTTTQIIHNDGSWSNAIRSLFIYGTGGYQLYLTRTGSPGSRFAIVGGSIFADSVGRFLANSINDPNYLRNYINAWRVSLDSNSEDTAIVNVSQGDGIDQAISQVKSTAQTQAQSTSQSLSNNFIPNINGLDDFTNKLTNNLMSYFTKKDIASIILLKRKQPNWRKKERRQMPTPSRQSWTGSLLQAISRGSDNLS